MEEDERREHDMKVRAMGELLNAVSLACSRASENLTKWADSVCSHLLSLSANMQPIMLEYERQRLISTLARIRDSLDSSN